jgi:hypothetical protein
MKYLVVLCIFSFNNKLIPTYMLIDCKAMGFAFINKTFATNT